MTNSPLTATLMAIHPDLAKWSQEKHDAGWTDEGIRDRLRTLMSMAARPIVTETSNGYAIEPYEREDDFAFATIIPARMIADLFVTAIEGGSGYWCEKIEAKNWVKSDSKTQWWYDDEVYVGSDKFEIEVVPEGEDPIYIKGHMAIERALTVMAQKYPHQMKDITGDNHDAETADVFLQCLVFGEIVYG